LKNSSFASLSQNVKRTFHLEIQRACGAGMLDSVNTFILLIAVRYFCTSSTIKSVIASSGSAGFLLAPFVVSFFAKKQHTSSESAAILFFISAFCFALASLFVSEFFFIAGSVLAMMLLSTVIPFITKIYNDNFPSGVRGKFYGYSTLVRVSIAIGASWLIGKTLDADISMYRIVIFLYMLAAVFSGMSVQKVFSVKLGEEASAPALNIFQKLKIAFQNKIFLWTSVYWMFLGTGNLMMVPLRVEYLANPVYAKNLSIEAVAVYITIVPNIVKLILSPFWGRVFDKVDFLWFRFTLTLFMVTGVFSFFTSNTHFGIFIGSLLFGISMSGSEISWNLWLTKFIPSEKIADFMSIHIFLTGIRGIAAPFLSFYMITKFSIETTALWSMGLMLFSSIFLFTQVRGAFREQG
jgi:MFS family permease